MGERKSSRARGQERPPSRAEGQWPALTQSQERAGGTQGRGGPCPTRGNGSRPRGLEGTVSRQLSQAKLKDLCRNLKIPSPRDTKFKMPASRANSMKHGPWETDTS